MLSSYIPSGTLLLVILGSAKQCLTPSLSVDGRCLVSIFYVCLHLCAWSFSLLDQSSSTNLAVQMECRLFFVSYSCKCEIITITYECRRPNIDVDANQQQEVLKLTPSCVAAADVLINDQALSTQAQRSALTHFVICPLLDLLLLIPSITSLRALVELFSRSSASKFQRPCLSHKGTQTSFTAGQYSPNFVT